MAEVIIATKNVGKAKEFAEMFAEHQVTIKTLLDYPEIAEVAETGTTFAGNAIIKAEAISKLLGKIVIADDSGLIVDALDGEPGVYSARYAGEPKDDERNNDKVLQQLAHVADEQRTARFYCALAVAVPNKQTETVSGTCEGIILRERQGTNGFGYDPIFFVKEKGKSMAELTAAEKNVISHRSEALKNLAQAFGSLFSFKK